MSVRVYGGGYSDRKPAGSSSNAPWVFAWITILGQIMWILVSGDARTYLTIATVVSFFLASATHAASTRGGLWATGYLMISLGMGFGIEVLGVHTGFPFGRYEYGTHLGPMVLGVPLLIPLAWSMMAYPCLLAGRLLTTNKVRAWLISAWLLATWDLFLDPQMVAEGHWTWQSTTPSLPGIPGIPITNFAGWFLAALVLMGLASRLRWTPANDAVPSVLLGWVYLSSVMAALVFFHRPGVAIWGGVLMGIAMIPWLWQAWFNRP